MMTIQRKLNELMKGKELHEVTATELAKCIIEGLKDRAILEKRSNIRDGGPILSLGHLLDRWHRARLDHWDKRGSANGSDKPG
jgi:hypothetical protein